MRVILSLVFVLVLSGVAGATTIVEVGDVGQTLATAQVLPGGVDLVTGTISGDADLFRFHWNGGDIFINSLGSNFDTQLFLFTATGIGVMANDDGYGVAQPSYLRTNSPTPGDAVIPALAAGDYFVAISDYDYDPYSTLGLMFQSYYWVPLYGPYNPQGLSPLDHWANNQYPGGSGSYQIHFAQLTEGGELGDTNPTGGEVPEPATLLLMGSGLLALASRLRK